MISRNKSGGSKSSGGANLSHCSRIQKQQKTGSSF